MTSVIAAVNDGIGMSGVLNGVFEEGEEPFRVQVYQNRAVAGAIDDQIVASALAEIAQAADVDAVNMSFGPRTSPSENFLDDVAFYRAAIGAARWADARRDVRRQQWRSGVAPPAIGGCA